MNKILRCKRKILVFIICSLLLNNNLARADTFIEDENKIKNIVESYFINQFESIENGFLVKENIPINNDELKKCYTLFIKTKIDWYKKIDEDLINYDVNLKFNNIKIENEKASISVTRDLELVFKKSKNIVQQENGVEYKFILNKVNGKWYIFDEFIYDFENNRNENNISDKLKEIENINNNLDLFADQYNQILKNLNYKNGSNLKSILNKEYIINNFRRSIKYSGEEAANYAIKYALNYNMEYTNWNDNGGDCTNFVSQCVMAGGAPSSHVWSKDSNAWVRVKEFRNYFVSNKLAKEILNINNMKFNNINIGDVIQLKRWDNNIWSHSVIISHINEEGQIFVTAHSIDRLNYGLYNYFPTERYKDLRILKFTN